MPKTNLSKEFIRNLNVSLAELYEAETNLEITLQYLKECNISKRALSIELGYSRSHVGNVLKNGKINALKELGENLKGLALRSEEK